jgi:hypothetical protein
MSDRPLVRLTEVKAMRQQIDSQYRAQITELEELIFRQELELLLGSNWINSLSTKDALLTALKNRLEKHNLHIPKETLRVYLQNVSNAFRAAIANGQDVSAIPYTGESYRKRGRPPKKKPFKHPDGGFYKTMTEAAKLNQSRSYAALKQYAYRERMKENSL